MNLSSQALIPALSSSSTELPNVLKANTSFASVKSSPLFLKILSQFPHTEQPYKLLALYCYIIFNTLALVHPNAPQPIIPQQPTQFLAFLGLAP